MKLIHFVLFCSVFYLLSCSSPGGRYHSSEDVVFEQPEYFAANHEHIRYAGRIHFPVPEKTVFSFPAVSISFRFTGTQVAVILKDLSEGYIQADGLPAANYFNVYLDNQKPQVLKLTPNDTLYVLASGLKAGEHSIRLVKRTEGLAGKVEFRGIVLEKEGVLLPMTESRSRKIEFIGNSITCGYGVEASSQYVRFGCSTENVMLSYASLAAEALHADFHVVCYSGRGVAQNYDGTRHNTVPEIWNQVFPDEPEPQWDHNNFIPDVAVINLGTNDFNSGNLDTAFFRERYMHFIGEIRQVYPAAKIVCLIGPVMNNNFPENALNSIRHIVDSMCQYYRQMDEGNIFSFELSAQTGKLGFGADWHPSAAQQRKNAKELTFFLRQIAGW